MPQKDDGERKRKPRHQLSPEDKELVKVEIPEQPPKLRVTNFDEVNLGYSKESAIEEANRCLSCKKPMCMRACPIKQDIQGYIAAMKKGEFTRALAIILERNPLPESVGRICPQFCAMGCIRGHRGDSVCIAALKRAAAEYADVQPMAGPKTWKKVAVIGSGPAGLAAAYYLAKWGHKVTVFDREEVKGGMLYTAIPEYRLPKDALAKDIERIERMGVEFDLGVNIGTDITLKYLRKKFNAIILCIGTHKPKFLGIDGEQKKGVFHVVPFLHDLILGNNPTMGHKIVVIGGGSSALDAARTLKRLGKDPILAYRRSKEFMPARDDEIREAEEEGVKFELLAGPARILGDEKVKAVEFIRMQLGESDITGKARPIPIEGSEFTMEADMVIEAISQEPDLTGLDGKLFNTTRWNTYDVDGNGMTTQKGVFAAGDCVTGPSTVVQAMASARKACIGIHRYLMGVPPPDYEEERGEVMVFQA